MAWTPWIFPLLLSLEGISAFTAFPHHVAHTRIPFPLCRHHAPLKAEEMGAADVKADAELRCREIERRRNLAIIAHPDAGKTTLTEKLLLYGGAVQQAGAVRTRADQRAATSDWMELEKQRGISITSTVLSFDYLGKHINLLDTPGHQDFSEDTYRTLAASDNAVTLIDAAKGLEPQTRKLLEVTKLSGIPVFTFCNKMDRPALSPFELIDQIEADFKLTCVPVVWPIGMGEEFRGLLERETKTVHLFEKGIRTGKAVDMATVPLDDAETLEDLLGADVYAQLLEDAEMLDGLIEPLDLDEVMDGNQTPMFFGSAMNNFGVELFLRFFLQWGSRPQKRLISPPPPAPKATDDVIVEEEFIEADDSEFSAFVFKLQANIDPKHRDRLAYLRVVSGRYNKGMKVSHSRSKRQITLASAQSLFGSDRAAVTEAFPGDVIGINNPGGLLSIGDTLYTGSQRIAFPGIPSFSPEVFAYVRNPDPGKYKNYRKGLKELMEEGAVQMLNDRGDDTENNPILAAVGQLQFEVVQHRMASEYGCEIVLEPMSYSSARWAEGGWAAVDAAKKDGKLFGIFNAQDRWKRPVLLFRNEWKVDQLKDTDLALVPCSTPPDIAGK
uniref:Tr-type G domain-containing protein n=1 Tax=Octactis speculum TaxID=3111310 RepID=A0A7S2FZH2_9STRA|eukprot:CAMPEP_0185771882 /NCGR_PEP_ID=MMETSP1174-20130828/65715_1 /TAXON_ID=35687 /ORGANISM="Dictyocha speculum, Strain CCMP1381" /LENGTH=610 /DNA_ID=CAMNT_0028457893 /DNA_START=58 /DNA_END=1890 /DNA_ORIENTATION=-